MTRNESLADAVCCNTSPFSMAVIVILYEVITPFCSPGGGAAHVSLILVELIATTLNDCGGPLGAEKINATKSSCHKIK